MEEKETGITFVSIPVEILQNKALTNSEKILYCYLALFKKGVCFQSNSKLAEMTGLDESTIKRGLKTLREMKYVFVEFVDNNSAKRRIYVVFDNPKKLEYLARKGLFSLENKPAETVEEPKMVDEPSVKEETPHTGNTSVAEHRTPGARPRRANFKTDEEFEKAFYKWNGA